MKATDDRLKQSTPIVAVKPDRPSPSASSLTTLKAKLIAVVLGKPLVEGRLSVEHSARISALVRCLKKTPLKPFSVCFASSSAHRQNDGVSPPNDDAPAAVSYFYHLCEAQSVEPPPSHRVFTTQPIQTRESMGKFLKTLRDMFDDDDLSADEKHHLLIFLSDYEEARWRKVDAVTPRLSLLSTVRDDLGRDATFESTRYPPGLLIYESADAFLARLHVVVDSLVPLLINLHAVVNKEEFLAREYYDDLVDAKSSIEKQLEFVESPMRPASLRLLTSSSPAARSLLLGETTPIEPSYEGAPAVRRRPRRADVVLTRATTRGMQETSRFFLDEALESVISLLSELERLLRPAALRTDSLTVEDWRHALKLLQRAMHQGRLATDPDRPLAVSDWGRLTDLDDPHSTEDDVAKFLSNSLDLDDGDVATLYQPPLKPF